MRSYAGRIEILNLLVQETIGYMCFKNCSECLVGF